MNTGQMLLTAGAVVLIGLTVSTVQRNFANHGFILQQTEIGIYKVSLGMSILEEAMGKAFDENSVDADLTSVNSLSNTLGKESEIYPDFDDFDDYNNLRMTIGVAGVDSLTISCTVAYIVPTDPNTNASTRTWHKRIIVQTWGSVQPDTLTFSQVFSYWAFR